MTLRFNLSPSSINLYMQSQLMFYYRYIKKAQPDTDVIQVYGNAGTIVHECLEDYAEGCSKEDVYARFEKAWYDQRLHIRTGFNKKPLSMKRYKNAVENGIYKLDKLYTPLRTEEKIAFPLVEDSNATIKLKGIIDLQVKRDDDFVVLDWKTSSSVKADDAFIRQLKHYALLVYKKYGIVPDACVVEYVKIGKTKRFSFTEKELLAYEQWVYELAGEIITKGTDINQYELGDFKSPFNAHIKKCYKERRRRVNKDVIVMRVKNGRLYFDNFDQLDDRIIKAIRHKYAYRVEGYQFSTAFQAGRWDGFRRMLKKKSVPMAYYHNLVEMIKDFNEHFGTSYRVRLEDERVSSIVTKRYNTSFAENDIQLRSYQEGAVQAALSKRFGIINLGTGLGKTIVSAEIIRRANTRTLFIVNRHELVKQTRDVYEDYLGVDIATMVEGEIDTSKQITVASIQTLDAVLKRQDKSTKKLRTYLYNVTCSIFDECQNVKSTGMYGRIANALKNCAYMLGLTGTAWRNDGATLEMNALVGMPIYTRTTKWGVQNNFLCPTKVYFLTPDYEVNSSDTENYSTLYKKCITENTQRNGLIKECVDQHKDDKKILILTKHIKHGETLRDSIENAVLITGSTPKKKRRELYRRFKEEGDIVLVGSIQIFSCGVNIPDLDVIINASANKSDVNSIQIIGRVMRKSADKMYGYYIDFNDYFSYFKDAAKTRQKALEKHGHTINIVQSLDDVEIL